MREDDVVECGGPGCPVGECCPGAEPPEKLKDVEDDKRYLMVEGRGASSAEDVPGADCDCCKTLLLKMTVSDFQRVGD
jgi:hypothetical protein